MKASYDSNNRDLSFEVGQFVWLKQHPYRQRTLAKNAGGKLSPKFYGPFKIIKRVGQIAYALGLSPDCKIHNIFHISQPKVFRGAPPDSPPSLPSILHGKTVPQPLSILSSRLSQGALEFLVQWKGQTTLDATWEVVTKFQEVYLQFELEDKLILQ